MENYISIDIGTKNIKILLTFKTNEGHLKIKVQKSYPSSGMNYGYISNYSLFSEALKKATNCFEKEYGIKIEEVLFSIDGLGMIGEKIKITHQTSEGIISDFDLKTIENKAKYELRKKNSDEIIEKINIKSTINDFEHFSSPLNLEAKKFETEFLFITNSKNNISILEKAILENNIIPLSFSLSIMSSAKISLSDLDKKLGCVLVDIGDEKTSILIYDNNHPIHYNVFKIGSKNITKKISLEQKISFEKAEKIKESRIVDKKTEKIISQEIKKIASKITEEIKKIDKEDVLPGGIILIGGGAKITNIEKIFKNTISLPVKKPEKTIYDSITDYNSAYGNVLNEIEKEKMENKKKFFNIWNHTKNLLKKFIL